MFGSQFKRQMMTLGKETHSFVEGAIFLVLCLFSVGTQWVLCQKMTVQFCKREDSSIENVKCDDFPCR